MQVRGQRWTGDDAEEEEEEFEGPMKNRGCRDVLCLLIFVAYVGFMTYLFFYSLFYGNVSHLTHGYDISGNVCGKDGNEEVDDVPYSGRDMEEKP